ncbi:MAG: hypothetical protein ABSH14_07260 [Verrucomicrobiia bacterium]
MNAVSRCVVRWICAAFLGLPILNATAGDEPFQANDLKRFLADSVPFLEWVRTGGHDRAIEHLMEDPKSVAQFPEVVRFLRDRGWEPERFAYVLNHVLVAYKTLGIGGESSRLLAKLDDTKAIVQGDATQSESEKERTLATIEECQREVRKTEKAFATLPSEEVRLMWLYRAELHKALDGRLPISKRVLPNPAAKKP